MKVIVTTSANPFHYGHLSLYNEAVKIFGNNNVKIAIGKNINKNIDFNRIVYHIKPYKINYEIAENITLSDYCKDNDISYIIRGIRNAVDAEYELKLDFLNKEINPHIQTMFFPTKHIFSNISSSSINELLKYDKINIVKKYMNEDAMYRFINKSPEFIVFFGKSCIGKTYYLENVMFKNKNIHTVNVDKIFWDVFEECYGNDLKNKIYTDSRELIYNNHNLDDLIINYSTNDFWNTFFNYIRTHYNKYNIKNCINLDININNDVYLLDFPSIGCYWKTIPSYLKGKLYLILLNNSDKNRKLYINSKNFQNKIEFLDNNYKEPNYFDEIINIGDNNE